MIRCDNCDQEIPTNQLVYDVATCVDNARETEREDHSFDPQFEQLLCEACAKRLTLADILHLEVKGEAKS